MPACVCVVCVRVSVYACEHVGRERACATVCLPARTVCVCLSIFKYTSRLMSLESFRKKQPLVAICVSFLDSLTVFEKTKKTKKKQTKKVQSACPHSGAFTLYVTDGHVCFLDVTSLLWRHNTLRPEAVDRGRTGKAIKRTFQQSQQWLQVTAGEHCLNF